jgi:NADPH:quinone reductase-like Zn-dependent oxidoreductase
MTVFPEDTKMKALRLHSLDGPDAFAYEDAPAPNPGPGEVLIRVRAAAVTPTELFWYPTAHTPAGAARPLPVILGHEFSGVVAGLGPAVTGLTEGDEVFGLNDWFADGAQAEYCVARPDDLAPKPRSIDHAQAAAAPISALTAWQGLIERARVSVGERVLVHGAAGGVGAFAVQLAHDRGAYVIGTASARNRDVVRELGADTVIDYRATRFEEVVKDADIVFDTVGGETLQRSWKVLKPGGRMVTIAVQSETAADAATKAAFFIVQPNREQLTEIGRLFDAGRFRSLVDAALPLAQGRDAYRRKPLRGKIVLEVAEK